MTSIATRVHSFPHLIAAAAVLILLPALHEPALAKSPGASRPPIPSADELKKLPPDGGPKWNRLVFEKSPYLLQHAANPVDWYPWGEEAFDKARREDKPVFLSIGYSTCHWCHVMEHESFEDPEAAKLINEIFVPVKVDREERPDVDQVYMAVTQAMTGSGGWPTTVFLTPDRKPFFAGTYFPKEGRFGRPGLMELLPAVARAWKEDRSEVLATADRATSAVTAMLSAGDSDEDLTSDTLARAYSQLASRFDPEHGGFGQAPKFPTPHQLSFLLRYWKRTGESQALHMVETTLQQMRRGGIFDQVGYGFHRYSTDAEWLLPHFEKMLYDQALLAMAYVDAYQATGKPEYAQTAREIFEYVQRDLQGEEGAFYSAEDADSEGEEGKFYVWTTEEVRSVLGDEEADLYIRAYGLEKEGNFRDEATGEKPGANIPHLDAPLTSVAAELQMKESALRQRLETAREKLFAARVKRIRPHLDDKILTDWNGLMIAALARGAKGLGEEQYAQSARRAADFLLTELQTTGGELLKRYRKGEAGLPALLDDYAFFVWGLLELYEATFDVRYLHEAVRLNDVMIGRFRDESSGGFFLPPESATDLLVRGKEIYDGAIPSGNSVAALNLLKLGRITGRSDYEQKAEALMRAFAGSVKSSPAAHTQLMTALDWAVGPTREVVIAGDEQSSATRDMAQAVRAAFLSRTILLHRPPGEAPPITGIAPFTAAQKMQQNKTTGYVCRNYACEQPVFATEDLREALER